MRDCPACAAVVDGPACPQCGYAEPGTAGRTVDPLRFRCHHEDRGLRCASTGTLSPNTIGDAKGGSHPGPWFCWQHARHVHGGDSRAYVSGKRGPMPARFAELRRIVPALRPLDAEDIAERLAIQSEGA